MEQVANKFNNDIVSVIIPVYNAEKYLSICVSSATKQTYHNIEIILVDDCSTDTSASIIREMQKKYFNIVYHIQPQNMGVGAARNTALKIARGRYVAFLDADDVWKPDKITKQISLMKQYKSPFGYTAIEMINEKGNVIKEKRKVKETIDYKFLLHNTMIATSTVVVDRLILGDFRMPLRRGRQDYATWLKLLRNGTVAVGIDEPLEQYRIVAGSLSSNKLKSIKQVWEIQTQDEGINKLSAIWNIICFSVNALMKYYG